MPKVVSIYRGNEAAERETRARIRGMQRALLRHVIESDDPSAADAYARTRYWARIARICDRDGYAEVHADEYERRVSHWIERLLKLQRLAALAPHETVQ